MTFICEHCGELIQGVAALYDGKFIHHRCADVYKEENNNISYELEKTKIEVQ